MKRLILTILLFLCMSSNAFAAVYYVSPVGSNTTPYDTWANAATTINTAKSAATMSGDIIEIDGGATGITFREQVVASYNGVTFRGSKDAGHNGKVTIDGFNGSVGIHCFVSSGKTTTIENLRLTISNNALGQYVIYGGTFTVNDCEIAGGERCIYSLGNAQTYNRCTFTKPKTMGPIGYFGDNIGTVIKFNYCKFFDMDYKMRWLGGTGEINNCLFIGNIGDALVGTEGTGSPVVTITNSVFLGNYRDREVKYLIDHAATGGGITVRNCAFNNSLQSGKSPLNATVTDGGGNRGINASATFAMNFVKPRMPAFFVFMNENAEEYNYFDQMAQLLEARGKRGTWTAATNNMTTTAWSRGSDFIARGHEVCPRTRHNANLGNMGAMQGSYAGACTMSINVGFNSLTTSQGLSLQLSNYATVGAMITAINSHAGYNFIAAPGVDVATNASPLSLADVTNVDISSAHLFSYDQTRLFNDEIVGSMADMNSHYGAGYVKTMTNYSNYGNNAAGEAAMHAAGYIGARGYYTWPWLLMDDATTGMGLYNIPSLQPNQLLGKTTGLTVNDMPTGWQHKLDLMVDMMQTYGGIFVFVNYHQGTNGEFSYDQLAAVMDHLIARGAQLTTLRDAVQWLRDNADGYYDFNGTPVAKDAALKMSVTSKNQTGNYHLLSGSPAQFAGTSLDGVTYNSVTGASLTDYDSLPWHRYSPSIGVYSQLDPISLSGGTSSNPLLNAIGGTGSFTWSVLNSPTWLSVTGSGAGNSTGIVSYTGLQVSGPAIIQVSDGYSSGNITYSDGIAPTVTPPVAPTGLTATAGTGHATVNFTPPASDGGSTILFYSVISSPGNIVAIGSSNTLITVTGLTNGTAYTFTVTATNAAGTGPASAPSNSVTPSVTAPVAPSGVTASAGNGQATVSFTPPATDGGSDILFYTVTSSPGNITATGGNSPITVTGLTNDTAYTFTVTATNAAGTGQASAPSNSVTPSVTATPVPALFPLPLVGAGLILFWMLRRRKVASH